MKLLRTIAAVFLAFVLIGCLWFAWEVHTVKAEVYAWTHPFHWAMNRGGYRPPWQPEPRHEPEHWWNPKHDPRHRESKEAGDS